MSVAGAERDSSLVYRIAAGCCLLIVALSAMIGVRAGEVSTQLEERRSAWLATEAQIAALKKSFQAPTTAESKLLVAEAASLSSIAASRDDELRLVDSLSRLARGVGLGALQIDVVAASADSAAPVPDIEGIRLRRARYDLAVDFAGGFAEAGKFVNSLPPSVRVSRLKAVRQRDGARYHLILSVFELNAPGG